MNKQIIDFISGEHICVLSILRADGEVHGASLHYSFTKDGSEFYFSTQESSEKAKGLKSEEWQKASLVVGFSEETWKTLQVRGQLTIAEGDDMDKVKEIHYARNPGSKRYDGEPGNIIMRFKPTWWRYSDFKAKPPVFLQD